MTKLYKNPKTGSYIITVPIQIVRAKHWKGGEEMEWLLDNVGNLILRCKV